MSPPAAFPAHGAGRDFTARVLAVVRALEAGDVVTYGEVAAEAGSPGAARAVGQVLRRTVEPVPWWRVVTAAGRLAPGKSELQAQLLRAEGVEVAGDHVQRRR